MQLLVRSFAVGTENVHRAQLEQVIAGLSEGVILLGPDRAILYANEAALRMHGVGARAELGRTLDEYARAFAVRYPEADDEERTPLERAAAGELLADVVVKVSSPKGGGRWTHRVRSLPLVSPDGGPDVIAVALTDVSGHLNAEDRFERAFSANPAPAVICRLSDLRFVKLNQGFLDLTGFDPADVLGRSVYEFDVLERAERRDLAIRCLQAGETIPQMEACLRTPKDAERFVIVAGQPLDINAEPCMLFTFADLEDRHKAEVALAQSEERFAKAFRLSPVPTAVTTLDDHRFLEVNDAFATAMGYGVEETVGRSADDLRLWADAAERRRFEAELSRTGGVRGFEARFQPKEGGAVDCLVSAETVVIGDRSCALSAFQDITERKRSESELTAAIEAAVADTAWFSRGVMDKLAALRARSDPASSPVRLDELTKREREIVALICRGAGDAAIGAELKLSPHTVRNHVASLYRKLGVNRRSAVVIWARERGFDGGAAGRPTPKR